MNNSSESEPNDNTETEDIEVQWLPIYTAPQIEISNVYPYEFRYTGTERKIPLEIVNGYYCIMVYGRYYSVFRLVLLAFHPKCSNISMRKARCKDGNSLNYHKDNLFWSTIERNTKPCKMFMEDDKKLSDRIIRWKEVPNTNISINDIECEICKVNTLYAISTERILDGQYAIFNRRTRKMLMMKEDEDGYLYVEGTWRKALHILVAAQWVINDDPINSIIVDHIDGDKKNNTIENLRYVSWVINSRNKHKNKYDEYELTDKLPEGTKKVNSFRGDKLEGLYYNPITSCAYAWNGTFFKKLALRLSNNGNYVIYRNKMNKQKRVYFNYCELVNITDDDN